VLRCVKIEDCVGVAVDDVTSEGVDVAVGMPSAGMAEGVAVNVMVALGSGTVKISTMKETLAGPQHMFSKAMNTGPRLSSATSKSMDKEVSGMLPQMSQAA